MTKLAGKIALVTGGRGGIGTPWKRFVTEGAIVYAADLTEQGSLAEHDADGSQFIKLDVTSEADAIAAMDRVRADHGRLDILVNAAGIEIETIEDTTLDEWNTSFAVNVTGTFLTSKYALPLMRAAAAAAHHPLSSILVLMMGLLRTRALPPIAQPRGGSCSNPCHGL